MEAPLLACIDLWFTHAHCALSLLLWCGEWGYGRTERGLGCTCDLAREGHFGEEPFPRKDMDLCCMLWKGPAVLTVCRDQHLRYGGLQRSCSSLPTLSQHALLWTCSAPEFGAKKRTSVTGLVSPRTALEFSQHFLKWYIYFDVFKNRRFDHSKIVAL